MGNSNWVTVAESDFPWERDALEFVHGQFPNRDPYRAWANFEFIADDGSVNQVDLLVFTPQGFFLVEIKSRPGRLLGDAGTWTWETEGRLSTVDSPLILTNSKAKKLRSLLQRQKACKKKGQIPYIEALVFCSATDLRCELQGNARSLVCLRDRDKKGETPARPGIMAAVKRRDCPGLTPLPKGTHDRPMAKIVSQAMEQAGIRPSQRHRKVSDYVLERVIGEGPGYQDWQAVHAAVAESRRRVRLYLVRLGATAEDRKTIERAALREFQLLETLQHPGVLRAYGFTEHELGPALIFEHDPSSIRLDHFLAQEQDKLSVGTRFDLLRQIAEAVRYAHDKKIVHRALCPQSILVTGVGSGRPRIKVFNWQVGYREGTSSSGVSKAVTATSHVDRLVEDASTAYMAPEALTDDILGEHLDVFSLGAIAYHVFSGVAPAPSGLALSNKLRETKGLQISSVLNGAGEALQYLIQYSTHPEVPNRIDTVVDFLSGLDEVENELTTPECDYVEDPSRAQQGDLLAGGYRVVRRLGQGACSVALLVEREGRDYVLKVASDPEHNGRLTDEAEVLRKLHQSHIIALVDTVELGDRFGFLMSPVFAEKDKRLIETLGQRLRKEGRLHVDLLERFGEDLLGAVNYLEEQGIPHRDIKPDNIAVGMVGRGDKLHSVLFDFSLSRTPVDNIRAGTRGYLDPLLPLRKPPRWDLHAERYAAAMTLHELATGSLPQWGDGVTDPSHLLPGTEITINPEAFDPGLREGLLPFFQRALRRNVKERFDNAEEMLAAWRECFKHIDQEGPLSDQADESQLRELLAAATLDSSIAELGLGTRATNALDRANILTVEDLLTASMRRLLRLRGVGNKTRREISLAVKILRDRLGTPARETAAAVDQLEAPPESADVSTLSVDLLAERILTVGSREGETVQRTVSALLGLDLTFPSPASGRGAGGESLPWPSQADVARVVDVTRARVGQILGKLQVRWSKDPAITRLRSDVVDVVAAQGGVVTVPELVEAVLLARGSSQDDPRRTQFAGAVVRAVIEAERSMSEPRLLIRRDGECILVAQHAALAGYARCLGEAADELADADPLVAPARVLERLREIIPPAEVALSDVRLVRLACAVSRHAALSSRQELYPRGMDAARAIRLSHGALGNLREFTVALVRERVASRYPEVARLPDRPVLDELLREAGFDFDWDPAGKGGAGCYVSNLRDPFSVTSGTEPPPRFPTTSDRPEVGEVTPEEADARQFEERLQRAIKEGSFLSLLVNPKDYDRARGELCRRFPVELVDFEGLFLDALMGVAGKAGVDWDLVLKTDAAPHAGDWDKLMILVNRAMPVVENRLLAAERTMLVIYAGLLARYDQMDLLSRLSQKVGRRDGIPGLWLLLPGDHQAMIDGRAVPLLGPGQRARIPESWLQNVHRANGIGGKRA
jgi:serine/threonine protein kinase